MGFRMRNPGRRCAVVAAAALLALVALPATAQDTALSPQAKAADANGNGVIERDEARGPVAANFDTIDTDKSGTLDGAEIRAFFGGGSGGGTGGGGPAARVEVDRVIAEETHQTVTVLGRIVARQMGPVAARVAGPIDDIRVDVGDRVKTGDVLAIVDRDRLRAERERVAALVAQRKADLDTATAESEKKELELKRLEALRNSSAFNPSRYEDVRKDIAALHARLANSRAQLKAAEAQLQVAAFELRDAEIRAPVVSAKHTEVGAYVSASSPVVTLINDRVIDIEVPVPANRVGALQPGVRVTARLEDGSEIAAVVRAVIPEESQQTRTRPVRLTPQTGDAAGRFADNQSVTVLVPVGSAARVVTVAKDAVTQRSGADTVFVVADSAAQPRKVTLGDAVGNRFVVRDGLKEGDMVVVRGNENLRPGQRVLTGNAAAGGGRPASGKAGGG
jgi:RND family efflux transporter MFP subunit